MTPTREPAASPPSPASPRPPAPSHASPRSSPLPPAPGAPSSETIAMEPGGAHTRHLLLDAGDLVHLRVEQKDADLILRLIGPGEDPGAPPATLSDRSREPSGVGAAEDTATHDSAAGEWPGRASVELERPLVELERDSPTGRWGEEELIARVPVAGTYRLEIGNLGPHPGAYVLRHLSFGPPTERDSRHLEADRAWRSGLRALEDKDWGEARERLLDARQRYRRLGLTTHEAHCWWQLGFAAYRSRDLDSARAAWESALDRFRLLGDPQLPRALLELGKLGSKLDVPGDVLAHMPEAAARLAELGETDGEAEALQHLGNAFRRLGRLQEAIDAFARTDELAARGLRPKVEAALALDRGHLELVLDRPQPAIRWFTRARQLYEAAGDRRRASRAHHRIAGAALRMDRLDRAEHEAWAALEALGSLEAARSRLAAFVILGHILRRRQDLAGAEHAYGRAAELAKRVGDARSESIAATGLALARLGAGHTEAALEAQQQALDAAESLGERGPRERSIALARSAEVLFHLGRLDEAREQIDRALALVESLRASSGRQDLRLSYFGSRRDYYDLAIDILLRLDRAEAGAGHRERALLVHERRLARELRESSGLASTGLDGRPAGDPELQARSSELLAELVAREEELADLAQAGAVAARGIRATDLLDQLHTLRAELRAHSGRQQRSAQDTAAELSVEPGARLEALRRELLDEESLALVFSLGEETSYLFELDRRELRVHALAGRGELEPAAGALLAGWRQTHSRGQQRAAETAREVSSQLLGAVAERLEAPRRLLVVGDGALANLPFAALPWPASSDRAAGDGGPMRLIDRLEVVQLPSLSAVVDRGPRVDSRRAGSGSSGPRAAARASRVVVFADPVYGPDDERLASASPSAAGALPSRSSLARGPASDAAPPFRRLPGSAREA
ncbi:MAG: hypothetical protein MI919_21195, partial [Holophagales bacterium]|nr:hypothetical protein [Holophagales bacterium]